MEGDSPGAAEEDDEEDSDAVELEGSGSQSTAAAKPLWVADAFAGRPGLRFTGTESLFINASDMGQNNFTIIVLGRATAQRTSGGTAHGGQRFLICQNFIDGFPAISAGSNGIGIYEFGASPALQAEAVTDASMLCPLTIRYVNRAPAGYLNGTLVTQGTPTTGILCSIPHSIGGDEAGNGFVGDIAEIFIYDGTFSEQNRLVVESWLQAKYDCFGGSSSSDSSEPSESSDGGGGSSGSSESSDSSSSESSDSSSSESSDSSSSESSDSSSSESSESSSSESSDSSSSESSDSSSSESSDSSSSESSDSSSSESSDSSSSESSDSSSSESSESDSSDSSSSGSFDLDIDSDNTGRFSAPDRSEAEEDIEAESGAEHPGKIILVNDADTDANGAPDFADGIDMFDNEGADKSAGFVPIVFEFPLAGGNQEDTKITFTYSASDPAGITRTGSELDGYDYTAAPGSLRLWKKDGTASRKVASASDDGDFIASGVEYTPEKLGISADSGTVTLYVEAIRPSEAIADLSIQVTSGTNTDTVRLTAFQSRMMAVSDEDTLSEINHTVEHSHPSPVISLDECSLTNLRPSTDNTKILGTLALSGTVTSNLCDVIKGSDGEIHSVSVFLNDEDEPSLSISTSIEKPVEPEDSFAHPYPFIGSFEKTFEDIEVNTGQYLIRLTARDEVPKFGITGHVEHSIEVEGQMPTIIVNGQPLEEWEMEDWTGWTFTAASSTLVGATGPGSISNYALEIKEPAELFDDESTIEIAGQSRKIIKAWNEKWYAESDATQDHPATFQFALGLLVGNPDLPLFERPTNFHKGFVRGLAEGGLSLVDGVVETVKLVWKAGMRYDPIAIAIRLARGDRFESERQFIASTVGLAKTIGEIQQRIKEDEFDLVVALLSGDLEAIEAISAPYQLAFEFGTELFQEIFKAYSASSDEIKGYWVGRATFEVVSLAIVELKLAHLSKLAFLQKLEALSIFAAGGKLRSVYQVLKNAGGIIARLSTTRMCFAAGTAVHTPDGSKPIEDIRVGEYVLSRDEATGEQGFRTVSETIVTYQTKLYQVTYSITLHGATSFETVTCTGEHPFYLVGEERFIETDKLQVGNSLLTVNGLHAIVNNITSTLLLEKVATYNLSIEVFQTYFIGLFGVWVHNARGRACDRAFAVFEKYYRHDGDVWITYDRVIARLPKLDKEIRLRIFDEARRKWLSGEYVGASLPPWEKLDVQLSVGFPGTGEKLGRNLQRVGIEAPWSSTPGKGSKVAAHHIVPHGKSGADWQACRNILEANEIGINEAANGVFLPLNKKFPNPELGPFHSTIHTSNYGARLLERLQLAAPGTHRLELQRIADDLISGLFP